MSVDPAAGAVPRFANDWRNLPELGTGLIYMEGLADAIDQAWDALDFIEVEPQQHWRRGTRPDGVFRLDEAAFETIASFDKPCLLHSVGCPIGGTHSLLDEQAAMLVESVRRLRPAWVSEHLSFNTFLHAGQSHHAGFLLPPLPGARSVDIAVARLAALGECVRRPLAIETGVNYLQPVPGEWTDGRFVRAVAESADCAILLDLHNVWTNARNGRQTVDDFLAELPKERVIEVHLAGGEMLDGYWLDAHTGLTPPELMEIAARVVPQLPAVRAITFEMTDEALRSGACDAAQLGEHLLAIRRLWQARGTRVSIAAAKPAPPAVAPASAVDACAPDQWEHTLGLLATGLRVDDADFPHTTLSRQLRDDPGLPVLRKLVEAARAGAVIDTLRLSSRLIALAIGRSGLARLLDEYWRSCSPMPIATDEMIRFGQHLLHRQLEIEGLNDLLRLEIAACQALADGHEVTLVLDHDPSAIIEAIHANCVPKHLPRTGPMTLRMGPSAALAIAD